MSYRTRSPCWSSRSDGFSRSNRLETIRRRTDSQERSADDNQDDAVAEYCLALKATDSRGNTTASKQVLVVDEQDPN